MCMCTRVLLNNSHLPARKLESFVLQSAGEFIKLFGIQAIRKRNAIIDLSKQRVFFPLSLPSLLSLDLDVGLQVEIKMELWRTERKMCNRVRGLQLVKWTEVTGSLVENGHKRSTRAF